MFNKISKLLKSSTVIAILLLSGCGGGHPTTADGGKITINPAKVTANISGISTGACSGVEFSYSEFLITVTNANGYGVADAPLTVTLDWANATDTGYPTGVTAFTLYDDPTWVSGSSTPPTNAVGASYTTNTAGDGTKRLVVGTDLSCTNGGYLNVSSGALFAQSQITITSN
jgi:hypothetical protein